MQSEEIVRLVKMMSLLKSVKVYYGVVPTADNCVL